MPIFERSRVGADHKIGVVRQATKAPDVSVGSGNDDFAKKSGRSRDDGALKRLERNPPQSKNPASALRGVHRRRFMILSQLRTKNALSIKRTKARKAGTAEYKQKREHLLECAARAFKDFGYDGASINHIARDAGIDRATLYYYYKGKKELFRIVIQRAYAEIVFLAESIASSNERPERKTKTLIRGLLGSHSKHHTYLYILAQEDMTS